MIPWPYLFGSAATEWRKHVSPDACLRAACLCVPHADRNAQAGKSGDQLENASQSPGGAKVCCRHSGALTVSTTAPGPRTLLFTHHSFLEHQRCSVFQPRVARPCLPAGPHNPGLEDATAFGVAEIVCKEQGPRPRHHAAVPPGQEMRNRRERQGSGKSGCQKMGKNFRDRALVVSKH